MRRSQFPSQVRKDEIPPMWDSCFWLARPGATEFVEQNRIVGDLDLPLNACGRQQVQSMALEIAVRRPARIYCGPEQHAQETAEILGESCRARVIVLECLRNWRLGLWQGMQFCELKKKNQKLFRQIEESPENLLPPEGETADEVLSRATRGWPRIRRWGTAVNYCFVLPDPLAGLIERSVLGLDSEIRLVSSGAQCAWFETPKPAPTCA